MLLLKSVAYLLKQVMKYMQTQYMQVNMLVIILTCQRITVI